MINHKILSIARLTSNYDGTTDPKDPNQHYPFPPVQQALKEEDGANGLLAMGGDLAAGRLLSAYCQGIFPWNNADEPILWWSPDPRAVIPLYKFHISKSLMRQLKKDNYIVTTDTECQNIIALCASTRECTWITKEMQAAYRQLHELGYVHAIEVWRKIDNKSLLHIENSTLDNPSKDKKLIGGLYGVAIGRAFFAESMFSLESGGSKIALCALVELLKKQKYTMLDCQFLTPHLASFGAANIERSEYLNQLKKATTQTSANANNQKWVMHWHYNNSP